MITSPFPSMLKGGGRKRKAHNGESNCPTTRKGGGGGTRGRANQVERRKNIRKNRRKELLYM